MFSNTFCVWVAPNKQTNINVPKGYVLVLHCVHKGDLLVLHCVLH